MPQQPKKNDKVVLGLLHMLFGMCKEGLLHVCLHFYHLQDRPSTKVHAAPGGGSSLGYLFGDGGN